MYKIGHWFDQNLSFSSGFCNLWAGNSQYLSQTTMRYKGGRGCLIRLQETWKILYRPYGRKVMHNLPILWWSFTFSVNFIQGLPGSRKIVPWNTKIRVLHCTIWFHFSVLFTIYWSHREVRQTHTTFPHRWSGCALPSLDFFLQCEIDSMPCIMTNIWHKIINLVLSISLVPVSKVFG